MNPASRHRLSPHNGFNQLLSVSGPSGSTSFGYDGNGNQVSKTDGFGTTSYAYNYDNRLVDIAGPGGSSHFEYDANGLRTKKSDSSGTRSYLLDGLSVVAEYAPDASKLAWYTQSLARIDEVLSVVNSTGKYWYEADALGSTYAMTNATGAVVSRSAYDVFGERSLAAGADLGQPFGFTGREHDQGGLVYVRARYLNAGTGRWDRPDPLGMYDGPNRFAYVLAAATRRTDPTGLFLGEMHRYITREAFAGLIQGNDMESILRGSVDADQIKYQFDDYRHGMRSANVTLETSVRWWVDFVDSQLALAVFGVNNFCSKEYGFWQLGVGIHALEDYYSPPHRMQVMNWAHPLDHRGAEAYLTEESGPVNEAIRRGRDYAALFVWMQRMPMSMERQVMAGIAWGLLGQMLFIDAAMQ